MPSPHSAGRKLSHRTRLQRCYDGLWTAAIHRIRAGAITIDPVLASSENDTRQGLTIIARPGPEVRRRAMALLNRWRRLEPEQYYYRATDLHVTVLSLFTATTNPGRWLARTNDYLEAAEAALRGAHPMVIRFEGVTVSTGTVMIQGFLKTDPWCGSGPDFRIPLDLRKRWGGRGRLIWEPVKWRGCCW